MGLDVSLYSADGRFRGLQGEIPSVKYPDHLFQRTYLRSSYNPGGFNNVVSNLIGENLYTIFGIDDDVSNLPDYVPYREDDDSGGYWAPSKPSLIAALVRATTMVQTLAAVPDYQVETFGALFFGDPPDVSSAEAYQLFLTELARREDKLTSKDPPGPGPFGHLDCNYSNAAGTFALAHPLEVVAVINGRQYGRSAVHLVTASDLTFYRQAAEIVVEFIEEALDMDEPRISWSA